jgi:hypothetical protein
MTNLFTLFDEHDAREAARAARAREQDTKIDIEMREASRARSRARQQTNAAYANGQWWRWSYDPALEELTPPVEIACFIALWIGIFIWSLL